MVQWDAPRMVMRMFWLVYSLVAWIFLLRVRQCRIAAFPPLFLAGAVFGWLVLDAVLGHIRPVSCLPLLLMPFAAVAVYTPVAVWGWSLPTNWLLYLVTMPLGFLFLARSLWVLHCPAR